RGVAAATGHEAAGPGGAAHKPGADQERALAAEEVEQPAVHPGDAAGRVEPRFRQGFHHAYGPATLLAGQLEGDAFRSRDGGPVSRTDDDGRVDVGLGHSDDRGRSVTR